MNVTGFHYHGLARIIPFTFLTQGNAQALSVTLYLHSTQHNITFLPR
jgi:hypothetical protein